MLNKEKKLSNIVTRIKLFHKRILLNYSVINFHIKFENSKDVTNPHYLRNFLQRIVEPPTLLSSQQELREQLRGVSAFYAALARLTKKLCSAAGLAPIACGMFRPEEGTSGPRDRHANRSDN